MRNFKYNTFICPISIIKGEWTLQGIYKMKKNSLYLLRLHRKGEGALQRDCKMEKPFHIYLITQNSKY